MAVVRLPFDPHRPSTAYGPIDAAQVMLDGTLEIDLLELARRWRMRWGAGLTADLESSERTALAGGRELPAQELSLSIKRASVARLRFSSPAPPSWLHMASAATVNQ
jgi:hypothetical protein